VNNIKRLKRDKYENKCFFGITSNAHVSRIVSLLNKYTGFNLSLIKNEVTIFYYENDFTEIILAKNKDFNIIVNPKLRGIDYVILVYTNNSSLCGSFFSAIRKLNTEKDIIFASKILEKGIEKKFRL